MNARAEFSETTSFSGDWRTVLGGGCYDAKNRVRNELQPTKNYVWCPCNYLWTDCVHPHAGTTAVHAHDSNAAVPPDRR